MNKPTLKRAQVLPLHLPEDMYQVLSHLEIGQRVPAQVLITDYKDGAIPPWIVREIEHCDGSMLILTACDESLIYQATLFEPEHCTAMDVFTLPTKTLAGPFYGYAGPGCEHARNPLTNIRQHARQIVDKSHKAETEVAA